MTDMVALSHYKRANMRKVGSEFVKEFLDEKIVLEAYRSVIEMSRATN